MFRLWLQTSPKYHNHKTEEWYYWSKYKTNGGAIDASKSLFSGEATSPDWFKRDFIKIEGDGGAVTIVGGKGVFNGIRK